MRCAVAAFAIVTLTYSAYGADLPVKALETTPSYNWTGFYTGAHLDYQAGQSRWSESHFGALGGAGVFDVGKGYDFSSGTGSYAIGFQGRYDYMDVSHHVFGVEGDIWFPNTVGGNQTFTTGAVGSATYSETVQFSAPSGPDLDMRPATGCSISRAGLPGVLTNLPARKSRAHRQPGPRKVSLWSPDTAERLALEPTLP